MTTNPPENPQPEAGDAVKELIGVILIVLGLVGGAVAAFAVDWRLGVALLAGASLAVGGYLTFGEA